MNIKDLKYLVALAEHQHFGKAAESCFVSQPALSMQIKKLEEFLGVQLIERTNKSFFITDIGKILTQQAREILLQIELMRDLANQSKDPFSGELHVGVIPTVAPYILPHIVAGFNQTFPNLTVYLTEETTSQLLNKLSQGKIDAAFLALPLVDEDYLTSPLYEEEFVLAVPPSHSFTKLKILSLANLENTILLLLEEGHCLRDQALSVCQQSHALESKSFRATSLETLRHMVASNVGMTLMPKLACQKNDGVCYLPFSSPAPTRTIGLVWRSATAKKVLLEKMVGQIKEIMKNQDSVRVFE